MLERGPCVLGAPAPSVHPDPNPSGNVLGGLCQGVSVPGCMHSHTAHTVSGRVALPPGHPADLELVQEPHSMEWVPERVQMWVQVTSYLSFSRRLWCAEILSAISPICHVSLMVMFPDSEVY